MHQSSALNWVLLILISQLLATRIEYIRDVLITGEKDVHVMCMLLHFVIDKINW